MPGRTITEEAAARLRTVAEGLKNHNGVELSDPQVIDFLLDFYEKNGMNKSETITKGANNEIPG